MKNILLLTPIYPAADIPKANTPVVHYFAKEWVKMGYKVVVINYVVNFPDLFYRICRPFEMQLTSFFSSTIRTKPASEIKYNIDGVIVKRIPMLKFIPHSKYSNSVIKQAFKKTLMFCKEQQFQPDCILAHWLNPQIQLIQLLKHKYQVPSCLVFHDSGRDLKSIFKNKADEYMNSVDAIGFRSEAIKKKFEKSFNYRKPNFYCYSGIPDDYILNYNYHRSFSIINSFIFVGTLIRRKYPAEIVTAVSKSFKNEKYQISFIGTGAEDKNILKYAKKSGHLERVSLLGRMYRDQVFRQLKQHDVFIMISKNETYGLVYLEAMAVGCITIASKNQGFDGIIKNGINGFLCEAGNVKELTSIINEIRLLDVDKLKDISNAAIKTARQLTDSKVAENYIKEIENINLKSL